MRVIALLGAVVSLVLAVLALDGCYRCDSPGEPRCPAVTPDYPPPAPMGCPVRLVDDAGFVTTVSQCVLDGHDYCGHSPCDAGRE